MRRDIHKDGIPVLCLACEARHKGICGALAPEQLVELARATTKRHIAPGSPVAGQSETAERYANILSGVVKLSRKLPDGRQQIVGLQFAPDFLGRPFERQDDSIAEAATEVSVCSFPRTVLERMMREGPGLEHLLLRQTLEELDEAREWMLTLGRKTAAEKVASFLLLIARNIDPGSGPEGKAAAFELPLTRADIADFLGLTIETVSRQLTRLRSDGVIRIENNRHVSVPNLAVLASRTGSAAG